MKNVNFKTLVPALVAAGVIVYEAVTGHQVAESLKNEIINGALNAIVIIGTVWGVIKSHTKGGLNNEHFTNRN